MTASPPRGYSCPKPETLKPETVEHGFREGFPSGAGIKPSWEGCNCVGCRI